jgi:LysR family transcriptional regulator, chromosome initiation inhibitor
MEYRCYATPSFAEQHFRGGLSVQAALTAPAVLFNRKDSLHDDFLGRVFGFRLDRYTKHYLPAPNLLMEGVLSGVGYGLVPAVQARQSAELGQLVDLAPEMPVLVMLYWHHWEVEPPLSQEITRLVVDEARRSLVAHEPHV